MVIAAWLRSHGRRVEVYPQHVRPTFVQRADYYDNGDLGLPPFAWSFNRVRRLIGFARAYVKERLIMADLKS
jgi:hypothetical protein